MQFSNVYSNLDMLGSNKRLTAECHGSEMMVNSDYFRTLLFIVVFTPKNISRHSLSSLKVELHVFFTPSQLSDFVSNHFPISAYLVLTNCCTHVDVNHFGSQTSVGFSGIKQSCKENHRANVSWNGRRAETFIFFSFFNSKWEWLVDDRPIKFDLYFWGNSSYNAILLTVLFTAW